jgi:hypothetical protein
MDVLGAAQREVDQPGTDRFVGQPVDQDEAASVLVLLIGIEGDRLLEADIADPDLVQLQRLGREMLQRVDVDLVLDGRDVGADRTRADLHQIGPPRQHRRFVHPHQVDFELVGETSAASRRPTAYRRG